MKLFTSFDAYEKWTEKFENASDYQEIPVAIDDGWKVSAEMFTACKSYKTALRRFEKAFKEVHSDIAGWVECMRESCENGCFKDLTGWKPAGVNDPEEIKEYTKGGTYSWSVEETMEDYWYIYLNISGIYASRQREDIERKKTILDIAYEKYRLQWMLDHGITLEDLFQLIEQHQQDPDSNMQPFPEYLEETGFGSGSLWVCKEEFSLFEYQDAAYMESLLNKAEFARWKAEI